MMVVSFRSWQRGAARFLARMARETAGNVIIIVAASLFPLLALVGSGIDMGRGYLAETAPEVLQAQNHLNALRAQLARRESVNTSGAGISVDTVSATAVMEHLIRWNTGPTTALMFRY